MWLVIASTLKPVRFRRSCCWLRHNKLWFTESRLSSFPRYSAMGAGGSTNCRSSPVQESPRPASSAPKPREDEEEGDDDRRQLIPQETSSEEKKELSENYSGCCDHREQNHAAYKAAKSGATPKVSFNRQENIDDEIEEIVANTEDIGNVEKNGPASILPIQEERRSLPSSQASDIQTRLSPNFVVGITEKNIQRTDPVTLIEKLPNSQPIVLEPQSEDIAALGESSAEETQQEIDFAKFRKANNRGATLQRHGKVIHHQDSDLLWRLGLISPETYTMKPSPRSAPTMQGPYLKPPSYDLAEEQLMANIEKEFTECTSAI